MGTNEPDSVSDTPPASIRLASIENYALTLGKASADDEDSDSENDSTPEQSYLVAAAPKAIKLELKE
jgi:hypothetical protein